MKSRLCIAFIAFIFHSQTSNAQGCSDAGFCTMGALSPTNSVDSSYQHKAKLSFSYGVGEQSTTHFHITPELQLGFIRNNQVQIKIPYIYVDGDLGSNSGLGDLSVSTSQFFQTSDRSSLLLTIGFKLPTGTTDKAGNGIALAMPYQTGLGTFDLILGVSYHYDMWRIGAGYQAILDDNNINRYLSSNGRNVSERAYFNSNMLRRGDDALIRLERSIVWKKLDFSVGLLSIYRLQKDKIINAGGLTETLKGSEGITLNLTAGMNYEISKQVDCYLLYGSPLIVRDVRADGLTREFVLSFGFQFNFGKN